MAYKLSLKDLISTLDKEVQEILARNIRKSDLDIRPHVLDVSEHSMLLNGSKDFKELYPVFIEALKRNVAKVVPTLSSIDKGYFRGKTPYVTFVNDISVVIGMSYDTIQKVIRNTSRDPKLIDTVYGVKRTTVTSKAGDETTTETTRLDVGHIPTAGSPYFISPGEQRISALLDTLSIHTNERVNSKVEKAFNDIVAIQANVDYNIRKLSGDLQKIEDLLGTVFVGVSLQTSELNQGKYNPIEAEILNKIKYEIAITLAKPTFVKKFLQHTSSNSIIEDITERFKSTISGKSPNILKHSTKVIKTSSKLTSKAKLPRSPKLTVPINPIRTTNGTFYSLASLQQLINDSLPHVLAASMGDGTQRNILNYRSGRFANSAQVSTMSQSREGMITAFYSYMKYPYQTFEPGYAQGSPKTRDPKLLIAKSIREIAATKVGNRLRAVLV